MKTNELSGAALDWAVAKCEGLLAFGHRKISDDCVITLSTGEFEIFAPSTSWSEGGPIIEREKINISMSASAPWMAWFYDGLEMVELTDGGTPLIAAMRCYVASKLGDEVQIPEELTHG